MKIIKLLLVGLAFIAGQAILAGEDNLARIKRDLAQAALVSMEVEIEIHSDIFEEIQNSRGEIRVAADGRYRADINDDIYLFDGKNVWEYSKDNNQATKREIKEGEVLTNRLDFIRNLDDYFRTEPITPDRHYRLIKAVPQSESFLPDSMEIYLDNTGKKISRMAFRDINGDLNIIKISRQKALTYSDPSRLRADFPKGTEIITLP